MSTPPSPPFAAESVDEPDRTTLDPEVAALLDFEPAPRKVARPDGWTDARQRRFIALLAQCGSPRQAAEAMAKDLSGARHLYRTEGADSFRAAWTAAIELAARRRRQARAAAPGFSGPVPGTATRGWTDPESEDEPEMGDEEKTAMVVDLARRFMRKVIAEREARLAGKVVAADFYLRQVTMLEIAFDLLAEQAGLDAWQVLRQCRRGEHGVLEIAETPLSRELDNMRRAYWRDQQGPERPEHPPERYTELRVARRGGPDGRRHDEAYRIEPLQAAYGACTIPAAGFSQEQWAAMDRKAQEAARAAQYAGDAAAQAAFERKAYDDWLQRSASASTEGKTNDGAADASI